MASRAKSEENTVVFNGQSYHPDFPPSEQDDVLLITRRFGKTDNAADVVINESELRNFAVVYCRLYLVPPKSRKRLEAWKEAQPRDVEDWELDGFFNSEKDDKKKGFVPRKPGCPQEAVDELERRREEAQETSVEREPRGKRSSTRLGDNNGNNQKQGAKVEDESSQETGSGNEKSRRGKKETQDPIEELKDALNSFKKVASRLSGLANAADDDDPFKSELGSLAQQIGTSLEHANKANEDLSKQLSNLSQQLNDLSTQAQAAAENVKKGKKRAFEAMEEDEDADEQQKEQRLKERRRQALARLNAAQDVEEDNPHDAMPAPPSTEQDTRRGRSAHSSQESFPRSPLPAVGPSRQSAQKNPAFVSSKTGGSSQSQRGGPHARSPEKLADKERDNKSKRFRSDTPASPALPRPNNGSETEASGFPSSPSPIRTVAGPTPKTKATSGRMASHIRLTSLSPAGSPDLSTFPPPWASQRSARSSRLVPVENDNNEDDHSSEEDVVFPPGKDNSHKNKSDRDNSDKDEDKGNSDKNKPDRDNNDKDEDKNKSDKDNSDRDNDSDSQSRDYASPDPGLVLPASPAPFPETGNPRLRARPLWQDSRLLLQQQRYQHERQFHQPQQQQQQQQHQDSYHPEQLPRDTRSVASVGVSGGSGDGGGGGGGGGGTGRFTPAGAGAARPRTAIGDRVSFEKPNPRRFQQIRRRVDSAVGGRARSEGTRVEGARVEGARAEGTRGERTRDDESGGDGDEDLVEDKVHDGGGAVVEDEDEGNDGL